MMDMKEHQDELLTREGVATPKGRRETAEQALQRLRARFGITEPLRYTVAALRPAQLVVPNAAQVKTGGAGFATNIALMGVLQDPHVVQVSGDSPEQTDARFRVVAGRRRVLEATVAGLPSVNCRVYAAEDMTPQVAALLVLSENLHRSPAWVEEIKAVAALIEEGVAMTDKEIADALSINIARVRDILKLAQLPAPLLEQIYAGNVALATARQIARLTPTQRQRLVEGAEAGEEITAESVKAALRGQIDAGLTGISDFLDEVGVAAAEAAATSPSATTTDLVGMEATLQRWAKQLASEPAAKRATLYIEALKQEIAILSRTVRGIGIQDEEEM